MMGKSERKGKKALYEHVVPCQPGGAAPGGFTCRRLSAPVFSRRWRWPFGQAGCNCLLFTEVFLEPRGCGGGAGLPVQVSGGGRADRGCVRDLWALGSGARPPRHCSGCVNSMPKRLRRAQGAGRPRSGRGVSALGAGAGSAQVPPRFQSAPRMASRMASQGEQPGIYASLHGSPIETLRKQ